jgi:hypothetical protein
MFRTILAAATAIPLLLGLGAHSAAAEDGAPEPPRNRLSPTDDSELPPRTVPPLAPPQPLIQRRISEPPAAEPPPRAAPPEVKAPPPTTSSETKPPQAKPQRATAKRVVTRQGKPQRATARVTVLRGTVQRRVPRQDDTSLGTLFTAKPPGLSPEAGPRTATYNYFGTSPAYSAAPGAPVQARNGAPCPTRSRTSLSTLFACAR